MKLAQTGAIATRRVSIGMLCDMERVPFFKTGLEIYEGFIAGTSSFYYSRVIGGLISYTLNCRCLRTLL